MSQEKIEQIIFKDYMNNQFTRIEKFDFGDIPKLKIKLDKEIKLLYIPSFNKYMPKDRSAQILDLGSGFGRFSYYCNYFGYKNYTGVDLSKDGIVICQKLFPHYQFINDDFNEYLDSTSQKFDLIFLSHVIEHIKKDSIPQFLERVKSRLCDSGIVIIATPNAAAYFGANASRYIDFTHEIGFTSESLEELLMAKSFKIISSNNLEVNSPLYKKFLHRLIKGCFELLIIALGYKKKKIYTSTFFTVAKK